MMPVFPNYVEIDLNGYAEQHIPNLYVSEFESGPAKQRRRSTKYQKFINFNGFICGQTNYKAFLTWWKDEIRQGSDWFCFTDPCGGEEKRARLLNFTIDSSPSQTATNTNLEHWNIQFQIEVWQ